MNVSRRQFLGRSAAAAALAPFALAGTSDPCEAAAHAEFDLSMGFPDGAIRLNYNENVLGPSPKAIEGALAAVPGSSRYALSHTLAPHVADYLGLDVDWVLMGTGSTELLRIAPITRAHSGGNVVAARETWGGMLAVAENIGLSVRRVDMRDNGGFSYNVDRMLAAVDSATQIFLIVTPNNPTGTTLTYEQIKSIADALPKDVLFVLDQAYVDYQADAPTGIDLLKEGYKNVLVTQTFSKAHALAGLRCGYGAAHPDILKAIAGLGCGPASVNMAAYGAVLGALSDLEHAGRSREYVQECRKYLKRECDRLGLNSVAGPSPFVLIELGDRSDAIHQALLERKIFVTHGSTWQVPDYLRVSYGLESENEAFIAALRSLV
ncbi:MAG: aminotransferase class I/II-fold pyridoxal phosphate-dependent enzyme [Gammaproteobacteria bacterium]|nr:aminotransferase class I/II-fold pyridoxal phosphate-dependent enzyme [Gammaproteobacteria bacterium]